MRNDEALKDYYDILSLAQDWVACGFSRPHRAPDFAALAARQASGSTAVAGSVPGVPAGGPDGEARTAEGSGARWANGVPGAATPQPDAAEPASRPALPPVTGERNAPAVIESEFATLSGAVAECGLCRLCGKRSNAVFGTGSLAPLVLVVGEGPGAEEDRDGLPFVGPAGKYLDDWLRAISLGRETNCYIANMVKCRPPNNRDPQPDELAACRPFLERQIELLKPKAILALGRIAAHSLTGTEESMGRLHGRRFSYRGIPLIPTYHPSAVLRDQSLRRPVWEDMKILRGLLDA